jgi:hypothetical protein
MCGTAATPAKIHRAIVKILPDFCPLRQGFGAAGRLHFAQSGAAEDCDGVIDRQ